MKAVVMAGGFGTRIQPLTNALPKPMLPAVGRPMMEHIMLQLKAVGIREFVVLLYFKPEVVKEYFGDGSRLGVSIDYVLPDDDYGTAGAVKKAEPLLKDEPFIIVSGDLITDFNFEKIIAFHEERKSKLTITLTSVADPLQFGVVITDKRGEIQRFLEKPGWGEVFSDTINTGIYVCEPEMLSYIPENSNFDFSKDLFPRMMGDGVTLWGYNAKGYWRDVGNPQSYREAINDILNLKTGVTLPGKRVKVGEGVAYVEPGVDLPKDLSIEGTAVIGRDVKLSKGIHLKNSVIGEGSTIERKVTLQECTLWERVRVGEQCELNNTLLCNDNILGKKCMVRQGAIVAEACELGKGVLIEKDITIWPKKAIEDAAVVSSNVIWGDKYKKSLFEGGQVKGRTNIELSCEMATKLAAAFASNLPVGAKVYVSRDYHKASRMLKRAFMSGLMSAGVDILNPHFVPSAVLRHSLSRRPDVLAGVHFRQSESCAQQTEILFYDEYGLAVNSSVEKSCERIFFRENFRRVGGEDLGSIYEAHTLGTEYIAGFMEQIDVEKLGATQPKVAVDLLYGNTTMVFPTLLNNLGVENVILNAYFDDKKLSKLPAHLEKARVNISQIVRTLHMNAGFLIYPHGQRLEIITETGRRLEGHEALMVVLQLLDATSREKRRVYLPVSAPDVCDSQLKNLTITRGKMHNLSAKEIEAYDLVATLDNQFAFTGFGLNFDAMFAAVKIVEMLSSSGQKLDDLLSSSGRYHFAHQQIPCDLSMKGTMMRRFSEEAMGKEVSFADGVKIMHSGGFVVMVPDQYDDLIHLYIQAADEESGSAMLIEYATKIAQWKQGQEEA